MSTLEWGATVSGALAVVGFFLPGGITKDFLLAHPLWGWAGLACLLIAGRWYIQMAVNARGKDKEAALAQEWTVKEASLIQEWERKSEGLSQEARAKDVPLLEQRMKGWEMEGPFQVSLVNSFHKRLPAKFVRQLEDQIERWNLDSRDFHDQEIAQAWSACKSAAETYSDRINFYMTYEDGTGHEFLTVPTETRDRGDQGDHYRKMFRELEAARSALEQALGGVYKVIHSSARSSSGSSKGPE